MMQAILAFVAAGIVLATVGCSDSGGVRDAREDEGATDDVQADVAGTDGETTDGEHAGETVEEIEAHDAPAADETTPTCRVEGVVGTLPGVRISIEADKCVFRVREGGEFRYRVSVAPGMEPTLHVAAGIDWGDCNICGADPLTCVQEWVGSDAAHYCECDIGLCDRPPVDLYVTLLAGDFAGVLVWPGVSWDGPSDTSSPYGPPFPPGSYEVRISLVETGSPGRSVVARLPIEVVP